MSEQTHPARTEPYEAERRARCLQGAIAACWLAIALLASFGLVDGVLFPNRIWILLQVRLVWVVTLLLFLAFLRTAFVARHALGASGALSQTLALMVDVIILLTGGVTSPYYAGLSLILMGMAVLLPWPPAWSLLNGIFVVAGYAALVLAWSPTDSRPLVNALAFLTGMTIIAVVSSAIGERLRWREFLHRTQLAEALRHKRAFLASVSHDLRTPLSVIVGYTQLLAEETFGPVTVDQADTLSRILRAASSQLELVSDLLDLARIEQGKLICNLRTSRIADLVPTLRETMDALLRDRQVVFEVEVAPDAVAMTDPERLRQVLTNLLTNAAKFTDRGHIRLVAALEGDVVRVSVSDTGAGMNEGLRTCIFEPFVSGEGQGAGWGLGLAIVAQLVQLLSGTVEVESTPGAGTSVHVRLPAASNAPNRTC